MAKEVEILERISVLEVKVDSIKEILEEVKQHLNEYEDCVNEEIEDINTVLYNHENKINELVVLKKWVKTVEATMVSILGVLLVFLIKAFLGM